MIPTSFPDLPGIHRSFSFLRSSPSASTITSSSLAACGKKRKESERKGQIHIVGDSFAPAGPIMSSCGIIMAGTTSSLLLAGQLAGVTQLSFAFAFGILLDTFVVRPLLVPSFLVLVQSGRLVKSIPHAAAALRGG